MVQNDKKKKTKEEPVYHTEETLQSKAPEEPENSSKFIKFMVAETPREPNDVPPFKRKKRNKYTGKKIRTKEQGESEGE